MNRETTAIPLTPLLAILVWVPAMMAASYGWRFGGYYDYGWFVPPAAIVLGVMRWRRLGGVAAREVSWKWILAGAVVLVPWLLGLRVLGHADPSWRMPMILLAATAAVVSHGLLAASHGWRVSAGFGWLTLLMLSAVPWPSFIEANLVEKLTRAVIHTVTEIFHITGRPVEMRGDRLYLHDMMVEVTDGCSGVRSFQSFVMATWFFTELQKMRMGRAVILLLCACAAAFVVNTTRSWALATIRFDYGVDAFDRAHDWMGLLAFLLSGAFFYFVSGRLAREPRGRMVVRRTSAAVKG
jgi:exosortase